MRPAGCARAPALARPRHLLRGQKSPGEVGGAAAGSDTPTPAFTSSPHPYLSSRCLAKDERALRSGRPHCPRPRASEGAGGAQGAQGPPTLWPAGSAPPTSPAKAAAWGLSPGTGRLASGDPARQPSRPLGWRPAPTGPLGFGLPPSWPGLGLELAPGDSPGGQVFPHRAGLPRSTSSPSGAGLNSRPTAEGSFPSEAEVLGQHSRRGTAPAQERSIPHSCPRGGLDATSEQPARAVQTAGTGSGWPPLHQSDE